MTRTMNRHAQRCLRFCGVAAAVLLPEALSAQQVQATPTKHVAAEAVDQVLPPRSHDGPDLLRRPAHPPLDEVPPLPMPHRGNEVESIGPGIATIYDAVTGEITLLPAGVGRLAPLGEEQGFNGVDGAEGFDDLMLRSFGTMEDVEDDSAFPYRMNCKIVMRFVDQNGVSRWFEASGAMVDAETVLTAAHCVYMHTDGTNDYYDWAEEVYVYPGWDGYDLVPGDDRPQHFGYGRGTQYLAFTSFTDSADFNYDVAAIRLTRGVGMLTGWYGYDWSGDCATLLDRTFYNASYPAEGCSYGFHNGRSMYIWSGQFDGCPGNQLQLDTEPGCWTAVWGGMSGSAAYYVNGYGVRVAQAVCSTSNRNDSAWYARLWQDFFHSLLTFRDLTRGNYFDLQPLKVRFGEETIIAGSMLTGGTHVAVNPTNGGDSGNYSYSVYLSSDINVDENDILLATHAYSESFAAMGSSLVDMPDVMIPASTPSGDYYVGVVYADWTDYVSANNDSDGWDAHLVHVDAVCDIAAIFADAVGGTYQHGDELSVNYMLGNYGDNDSGDFTLSVRASTDHVADDGDQQIGIIDVASLAAGEFRNEVGSINIPYGLAPGTYYIGIIAQAPGDMSPDNDTATDTLPVTVQEGPCPGDLDGDGDVDQGDLGIVLASFEVNGGGDLDGDGDTDQSDLGVLLSNYGCES